MEVEVKGNKLAFIMLKGSMVTYTGKVGTGLIEFSKEVMLDALSVGLRVAYITGAAHLNTIMEPVSKMSSDHDLTLYPINEEQLKNYPNGYLEDSIHQINSENYDVILINAAHLLSPTEKDLLIKQQNDVVTYIFEQEAFQSETAEDILNNLDFDIKNRSFKIIHLEKRTGYDFTAVKDREI